MDTVSAMNADSEPIISHPPVSGNERDMLLGELERVRGYLAWKCGNLDAADLSATLGPSTMTVGACSGTWPWSRTTRPL